MNRGKIESNLSVPGIQGCLENALYESFEMSPLLICLWASPAIPLRPASGLSLDSGWRLRDVGANLQTYQVGAHFEALIEGVFMGPWDSRYSQVGFNLFLVCSPTPHFLHFHAASATRHLPTPPKVCQEKALALLSRNSFFITGEKEGKSRKQLGEILGTKNEHEGSSETERETFEG